MEDPLELVVTGGDVARATPTTTMKFWQIVKGWTQTMLEMPCCRSIATSQMPPALAAALEAWRGDLPRKLAADSKQQAVCSKQR
jgi:hypothetical protein